MKLIACLIVFCLILIVLSNGLMVTTVGQLPKGHIVLEQLQSKTLPCPK